MSNDKDVATKAIEYIKRNIEEVIEVDGEHLVEESVLDENDTEHVDSTNHKEENREIIARENKSNTDTTETNNMLPALYNTKSALYSYLAQINKIPSLSQEEELSLAISYIEKKDLKAAHKLITSHLKLVAKIAMNYKNYNIPTIDMISEGNIGLLRAVEKYNPDFGYRLSTYAMWWIKAAIQDYILKSWSMVKGITTNAHRKIFFALRKLKKKIINAHISNNPEEYKKIAEELGVSIKEIIEIEDRIANKDISLNQKIYDNSNSETQIIDTIASNTPTQEVALIDYQEQTKKKQLLQESLEILNDREKEIVTLRNLTEEPLTLDVLSKKFNVSKERIRQIEEKALTKIKKYVVEKTKTI